MASAPVRSNITWPDGKIFAFTVFDDTDGAILSEIRKIYSFLLDHGIVTTKSVWPLGAQNPEPFMGATCEVPDYVEWLLGIRRQGVEIAYHNASCTSSDRERTIAGLQRFEELFGQSPRSYTCHSQCRENIYWGSSRLSSPLYRTIYNMLTGFRKMPYFQGHVEDSKWFWGDLCRDNIQYVRNFTFSDINTLRVCPFMPYHDSKRPFVNAWFASSDAGDVDSFIKCISEERQDMLEEQGGACIIYTHFSRHFYTDGSLNTEFTRLIKRLAGKNGWFVPTSTLLDYLTAAQGVHVISDEERNALERRWLLERVKITLGGRR